MKFFLTPQVENKKMSFFEENFPDPEEVAQPNLFSDPGQKFKITLYS